MKPKELTDEEYVKQNGTLCPRCKSKNIEAGEVEAGDVYALQEVTCVDCGKEWNDIFHLVGWGNR
jgi:transposase-like protein